jgi:hypothetical protein
LAASSFAPKVATPELKRAAAAMKSAEKNQGWWKYIGNRSNDSWKRIIPSFDSPRRRAVGSHFVSEMPRTVDCGLILAGVRLSRMVGEVIFAKAGKTNLD